MTRSPGVNVIGSTPVAEGRPAAAARRAPGRPRAERHPSSRAMRMASCGSLWVNRAASPHKRPPGSLTQMSTSTASIRILRDWPVSSAGAIRFLAFFTRHLSG